jgi:hypothetical protein
MPRKTHSHSALIDPQVVEDLIAGGCSIPEVAGYFGVDPSTLYYRNRKNPELRNAVKRGQVRREDRDVGHELESELWELLRDVKGLRGKLAA